MVPIRNIPAYRVPAVIPIDNLKDIDIDGELEHLQGHSKSIWTDRPCEIGVVPPGSLELSLQGFFRSLFLHALFLHALFLHDGDGHVSKDGEIVGTVAQARAVPILVHHHVETPVQRILDIPVGARDLVQAFGRQGGFA